jgi:PAS domain S-box-containing protein
MRTVRSRILSSCLLKVIAVAVFLFSVSNSFSAPSEPANNRNILRVVMDDNYPPYVFKGDNGQLKGIIIDQWNLWEKKTGIHVEISGMDWAEAQRKMQAEEFDVIDTMFRNEKRDQIYDFTKPYAVIPVPLFFHADISGIRGPRDARGFMVAAKAGGNVIDVLKKHGVTNIVEYPSYEKIIEAARDGKVKVFTVDRPPALYFLNKMRINDQFRETKPLYSGEFHRAVLKGRNDVLALVEKGFADITPAEYRSIDKNWMGTPISVVPYFRYIGYSVALVALFVSGLLVWLRMLKQAVSTKTQKLTESEERLSLALIASKSGIWDWNVKTGEMFFDSNYFTLAGYEPNEFDGSYDEWEKRVHPDDVDRAKKAIEDYLTGQSGSYVQDFRFKNRDGSWQWLLDQGKVIERDERGNPVRFIGMHTDITGRKEAEERSQASERRFKELIKNSSDSVTILDKNGVQIYVSNVVEKMLGYSPSELINIPVIKEMIHPDDQESVIAAFLTIINEGEGVAQYRHKHKNGSWVYLEAWGTNQLENPDIHGIVVNVRDITERKRAEEDRVRLEQQLLHAQKLESLGVLAGGIAHDFNNILTTIIGNAELALLRMKPESPGISNIHKIGQAATQAADLAKQMLAYSGKGKFVIEHLDINCLLEEMLHLLDVSISKMAKLRLNFASNIPAVEADATQIRQIVMNLVINASEAIGDNNGVITITTGCRDCDKIYLRDFWLDENIQEGAYVFIDIADTGCGMDRDTLAKIFDPFFTTKFTGRGLGMAAVQGIIKGHRGAIKVDSQPGKGTVFKILLPASSMPTETINRDSHTDDWKGEGKVLLVDDEETIRDVAKEMLQEFGFTTITANDGRDAIEIFKESSDIVFVILDLTMPNMDGEQCFRELKQINPDVKVIISSGFSEYEVTQKFTDSGLAGFIQKPYKLSVLKGAIQNIQKTETSFTHSD